MYTYADYCSPLLQFQTDVNAKSLLSLISDFACLIIMIGISLWKSQLFPEMTQQHSLLCLRFHRHHDPHYHRHHRHHHLMVFAELKCFFFFFFAAQWNAIVNICNTKTLELVYFPSLKQVTSIYKGVHPDFLSARLSGIR